MFIKCRRNHDEEARRWFRHCRDIVVVVKSKDDGVDEEVRRHRESRNRDLIFDERRVREEFELREHKKLLKRGKRPLRDAFGLREIRREEQQ